MSSQWTANHTNRLREIASNAIEAIVRLLNLICSSSQDEGYRQFFQSLDQQKIKIAKCIFQAAVVAQIKCGKSTLLDGILQGLILPEDTLPETSSIVSIEHVSGQVSPKLHRLNTDGTLGEVLATGETSIYQYIKGLNTFLREKAAGGNPPNTANPPYDLLMRHLRICIEVPCLRAFRSDNIRFLLMDTPGVNEANSEIKRATDSLLNEADVVIYLLNINHLGAEDEFNFLSTMATKRTDLLQEGRAYFLLNKAEIALKHPEIIRRAKEYVGRFLDTINPQLKSRLDSSAFAMSTRDYLVSCLILNGKADTLTPENLTYVQDALFGRRRSLAGNFPRELTEEHRLALEDMQDESGFSVVESHIIRELTLNAPRLFCQAIIGNLNRILQDIVTSLEIRVATLAQGEETVKKFITTLENATETMIVLKDKVYQYIETKKSEFNEKIIIETNKLKNRLDKDLTSVCSNAIARTRNHEAASTASKEIMMFVTECQTACTVAHGIAGSSADFVVSKIVNDCDLYCREEASRSVTNILLEALKVVLPEVEFNQVREQIHMLPRTAFEPVADAWKTGPAATVDSEDIQSKYIEPFQESIMKKEPFLIPATYKTVREEVGGSNPGLEAIKIVAKVLICPVLLLFGGGETKQIIERQVVETEAKIDFKDVEEKVERFQINYDSLLKASKANLVPSTIAVFEKSFELERDRAFDAIRKNSIEPYFERIEQLKIRLRADLQTAKGDATKLTSESRKLADALTKAKELLQNLSRPITEMFQ